MYQTEGLTCFGIAQLAHALLLVRCTEIAELNNGDAERQRGQDDLPWLPVDRNEDGPKRFVTSDNFVQGARQRVDIQSAGQTDRGGNIVDGETWFQFVEKPKSLLSKRERKGVDGAVVTLEQILDQLNLTIANTGKIFLVRAHITSAQRFSA